MRASIWPAEIDRLAALQRYRIWDTQPEDCFDTITRLASQFFKSPVSWISLMGANRQWFKSVIGLNVREHPREGSLCARTISAGAPFVIRDASADLQFAGNLLVRGEPHIRFYAGIPLQTPDGYNIGTFCVADAVPRGCTDQQLHFLKELSRLVLLQLEARLLRLDEEAAHRKAMVRSFTGTSDPDRYDSSHSAPLLAAAHNIRTPLNGIFAAADLLALTDLTPEQREYLEIVRTSSRNLLNLAAEALKQFEGAKPSPPATHHCLQYKRMPA